MDDLLFPSVLRLLHAEGWDAIGVGATDSYNAIVIADGKEEALTLLPPNHLVICVGHSKKKWNDAKKLLNANVTDPFDRMSERLGEQVRDMCHSRLLKEQCQVFYSHSLAPFLVSFQRLAVATAVGVLHADSHLVLHPQYGPWLALRVALVFGMPGCSGVDPRALQDFVSTARAQHSEVVSDATGLVLQEGEGRRAAEILSTRKDGSYDKAIYQEARKSFVTGRAHMYDDDQMTYHYNL